MYKQNTWSTIQGIIIHIMPEAWVLCEPHCRKTALTIADVSGKKDMTTDVIRFFFCFDKVSIPVFIGKYYSHDYVYTHMVRTIGVCGIGPNTRII
jgi:hypothetical protein